MPARHDTYSPDRRTVLVLGGTGADGAYHAGVLRALHESGVRIDLVAGRGIGAVAAAVAAVGGEPRLWERGGLWRSPRTASLYRWGWPLRVVGWSLAGIALVLLGPLGLLAAGLAVYVTGLALGLAGLDLGARVAAAYPEIVAAALAPGRLPTWLPRVVVLLAGLALAALAVGAAWGWVCAPRRRRATGGWMWGLLGAPLDAAPAAAAVRRLVWDLLRGGAALPAPAARTLSERYEELLRENLTQPGFRELLVLVHDLDAQRDLIFALLAPAHRERALPGPAGPARRRAEAFDLAGDARGDLLDVLAGTVAVPGACEPALLQFRSEGFWRGETHRLVDRPGSLAHLVREAALAGAEQAILVTAAPAEARPHALRRPRLDGLGRLGEHLASEEAAAVEDALVEAGRSVRAIHVIRPEHNPIGPFDLRGAYDERSDRWQSLDELMDRGYEDAHRVFIDPVLGAPGDHVVRTGGGAAR